MLEGRRCKMLFQALSDLFCIYLSVYGRQRKHFMPCMLHGTGLMDMDMPCIRGDRSFIRSERCRDDRGVGLRTAHKEMHFGFGTLTGLPYQVSRLFAPFIHAVSFGLLKVSLFQKAEYLRMGSFCIV